MVHLRIFMTTCILFWAVLMQAQSLSPFREEVNHLVDLHSDQVTDRDLVQLLDSIYWFAWYSNSDSWLPSYRYRDYVYSADGKLLSRNGQYNPSADVWQNEMRNEFTYDANGLLIQNEGFYGIGTGWTPAEKTVFGYDEMGFLLMNEGFMWNNNAWQPSQKNVYVRDNNHRDSIVTAFQYSGSEYQATSEHRYSYSASNRLVTDSTFTISNSVYAMSQNYHYDYTQDDLLSIQVLQNYNSNVWVNVQREEYTYNSDLQMISDARYSWQNGQWDPVNKWEGSFVSPTLFEGHTFSWNNNVWNEISVLIRNFNTSAQLLSEYDTRITTSNFNHRDVILNEYDPNGFLVANSNSTFTGLGQYNLTHGDSTHYYFGTLTNILNLKNGIELTVFPNPSSTGRYFVSSNARAIQEIIALDSQGRFIQRAYSTNCIDLSEAENGVYFLFISVGESMVCRQVVVRR